MLGVPCVRDTDGWLMLQRRAMSAPDFRPMMTLSAIPRRFVASGFFLRPSIRPTGRSTAASAAGRKVTVGKPANTTETVGKQAEPTPGGQPAVPTTRTSPSSVNVGNQAVAASPSLPARPDDLPAQGWKGTSHPGAARLGQGTFANPKTGEIIRFDKGRPGEPWL